MATVTNPDLIRKTLQGGGSFDGDPVPARIYEYRSVSDCRAFAVFYRASDDDVHVSPAIREYRLVFANGYMTDSGMAWYKEEFGVDPKGDLPIEILPTEARPPI
jgi:hypothetical protein